jgi:hypothetical protein
VLLAVLQEAAEHAAEETSKTPFYVASAILVIYAALLSAVGTARHATFPPSRGIATGLMLLGAALVAAVMATAVITA